MADNIGTQLTARIEEISNLHGVMQSLSIMATCINDYDGFQSLVNVFVYLEDRHNSLFDELRTDLLKRVLPIVSHINDKV